MITEQFLERLKKELVYLYDDQEETYIKIGVTGKTFIFRSKLIKEIQCLNKPLKT